MSAARHRGPGRILVDARLAGQAEHLLTEDVAQDLRRAALDRVGAHAQERVLQARADAGGVELRSGGGTCSRSRPYRRRRAGRCRTSYSSLLNSANSSLATDISGPGLPALAASAARMLVSRPTSPRTQSRISSSLRAPVRCGRRRARSTPRRRRWRRRLGAAWRRRHRRHRSPSARSSASSATPAIPRPRRRSGWRRGSATSVR